MKSVIMVSHKSEVALTTRQFQTNPTRNLSLWNARMVMTMWTAWYSRPLASNELEKSRSTVQRQHLFAYVSVNNLCSVRALDQSHKLSSLLTL
jgi:hypothetical protein